MSYRQAGLVYPSRAHEFTPGFMVGSVLLIFLGFFVLSYYVSLRSEFLVVMHTICVCLRIVVSNTFVLCFCFVFLRLLYPLLPVSLDCPFLIALSVFSNVFFLL